MLTPNVTPITHAGASPHAPGLTPAEAAALKRCTPLNTNGR